jgi:hypothetical protein
VRGEFGEGYGVVGARFGASGGGEAGRLPQANLGAVVGSPLIVAFAMAALPIPKDWNAPTPIGLAPDPRDTLIGTLARRGFTRAPNPTPIGAAAALPAASI